MSDLEKKKCRPCEGIGEKFTQKEINEHMQQISQDWRLIEKETSITKKYTFKNYYEVLAFVNAIAWVSHYEDHHPSLIVNYDHCQVTYSTHALGGLTENDFICATKVDGLLKS